jgi:hypothetical protein
MQTHERKSKRERADSDPDTHSSFSFTPARGQELEGRALSRCVWSPASTARYALAGLAALLVWSTSPAVEVEKWKQFRVSYQNSSWSGNPYDLDFTAEFTHGPSGRTLRQFGFYSGNDTWKIYFMPDDTGQWTYVTTSPDSDLDGLTGSFDAVSSSLPGKLTPTGVRWKESDGHFVAPMLLSGGPYIRSEPISETQGYIDWARDVAGAEMIGTTLLNFEGDSRFTFSQEDRMYRDDAEGENFYLPTWDRCNDFYDAVRDKGMGHYILIYSDDGSDPSDHGIRAGPSGTIGPAELRLFKYLVARLAPYPKVMWDTGIDIGETRGNQWIENFAIWFRDNDPWGHPVGSRTGSGSGGTHPEFATYYSDGEREIISRSELVSLVEGRDKPTAMTDRFREDYSSPCNCDRDDVRRAAWQWALTYGTAIYFGGNEAGGYLIETYATDLQAAPDLGQVTKFVKTYVNSFGTLTPNDSLKTSGSGFVSATPGSEYVAFLTSGSSITLDLGAATGPLLAQWYDPMDGSVSPLPDVPGAGEHRFDTPGTNSGGKNEWVLHVVSRRAAPSAPRAVPSAPREVQLRAQ